MGEMWFHRNRKTVSILFRPTLSGTLQETWGSSEVGCCWCARSCDSRVIERKSPEQGPKGKDRYGTITNPNPAGRHAREKAPRFPCIALRPRFGGASFLRPIQIGHDGYRWMAQRLSRDGACFYLARLALAQRRRHSTRSSPPRTLLTDPLPARWSSMCLMFLCPGPGLQDARCRGCY
jgi:hypothetical protein